MERQTEIDLLAANVGALGVFLFGIGVGKVVTVLSESVIGTRVGTEVRRIRRTPGARSGTPDPVPDPVGRTVPTTTWRN